MPEAKHIPLLRQMKNAENARTPYSFAITPHSMFAPPQSPPQQQILGYIQQILGYIQPFFFSHRQSFDWPITVMRGLHAYLSSAKYTIGFMYTSPPNATILTAAVSIRHHTGSLIYLD